jgi:hypothetical protein
MRLALRLNATREIDFYEKKRLIEMDAGGVINILSA